MLLSTGRTIVRSSVFQKIGKVLQYHYRHLSWKAGNEGNSKLSQQYMKISSSMSLSRKMFRLARSMHDFEKLVDKLGRFREGRGFSAMRLFDILRAVASFFYMLTDNVHWVQKVNIMQRFDSKKINKLRIFFWMLLVGFSYVPVLSTFLEAYKVTASKRNKSDLEKEIDEENYVDARMQVGKLLCDSVVCVNFGVMVELLPSTIPTHDGVVGVAGAVSGILALASTWRKLPVKKFEKVRISASNVFE